LASTTDIEARGADITQILRKYETLRPFSSSKSHIFAIITRNHRKTGGIEETGAMLCIVELLGNGLIKGYGDLLSGRISCVARLSSDGFFLHATASGRLKLNQDYSYTL